MFKLPYIPRAEELIDVAFRAGRRKAREARSTGKRRDVRLKQSDFSRVEAASKILHSSLKSVVKQFPPFESLSPFHQALLDVKVDRNRYKKSLGAVDWCRKQLERLEKRELAAIRRGDSTGMEFLGRASSFVKRIGSDLDFLVDVKDVVRRLPTLEDAPTLVVAGFPNVGKSTFVKNLTGSDIEIKPYPFTTKDLKVGHVEVRHLRYQIVDCPGLLDRPMEKRNKIELQAIAALRHLADKVLFVLDPTQDIEPQLGLLDELSGLFKAGIFVAVNKVDIVDACVVDGLLVCLSKHRVFRISANNPDDCMAVFRGAYGF
jgi:nucleolar GTP-binding protein